MVFLYAKNEKLLLFNQISIKNTKEIKTDILFDYINYKSDSVSFYNNKDLNRFSKKINDLQNKNGIIKNIKTYYSLPNKIIFDIEERQLSYLIKSNNDSLFMLDNLGMIIDIDFLSSNLKSKIPEVNLIFNDFHIYHTYNDEIKLDKIFKNIKKNKSNNTSILNTFLMLNSFDKLGLSNQVHSVIIDSHYIIINYLETEILFGKNDSINNQIEIFEIFVNNLDKNSVLNFNSISDLKQIRLDISGQIVCKS